MTAVLRLDLPAADVDYRAQWLAPDVAMQAMAALVAEVQFEQHRVRLFGREHLSPRLSAWIGDSGAVYSYSRVRYLPAPWTPTLVAIRHALKAELAVDFNSVLVNRYRDGRDSMGWHADDEAELGPNPVIASVSLGATRRLRFRARPPGRARAAVDLESGSLLVMAGRTQQLYQHAIDKTRAPVGERINLTFRVILSLPGEPFR